jgi:hypothetical protein
MSSDRPLRPIPRPRASHRRFFVRRLVAGVLVVAVVFGLVRVASGVFGGDAKKSIAGATSVATTAPASSDGSAGTVPDTSKGSTPPAATTVPGPTTPPEPKPVTTPTKDHKAVLYIAGDSDAGTFGPYLHKLMDQTGIVDTTLDYKVSSGLARPDFFDWPAHFAQELPTVNPDIVVVTFGGNDAQGLTTADGGGIAQTPTGAAGGDTAWRAEYAKRVGAVMDVLAGGNRTLIWVGIPNHVDPQVTARMSVQDETVKAEAAKRPKVVVIDTWARFSGRNGGYGEYVVDPRDGIGKDVRASDGFHLNQNGAEILALDIAEAIRKELRARGATL